MSVKIYKNNEWKTVSGGNGGGSGEPAQYLKTITKDETNKKITITDKAGTATEFPYGTGGEPAQYVKKIEKDENKFIVWTDKDDVTHKFEPDPLSTSEYIRTAEVVDTNTLKLNSKDGSTTIFTPTVSGGVTQADFQKEVISLGDKINNEETRAKNKENQISQSVTDMGATKVSLLGNEAGSGQPYHFPYNIRDLKYDTADHKLKGSLDTITLDNEKTLTTYPLEIEMPDLAKKLDIVENLSGVYAQYDDSETRETKILPYSEDVEEGALVQRDANGAIFVRATPTEDNEAISKGYLESHAGASALINDTTPSTTTAYSGTKTQNLVNALTGQVDVEVVTTQPASPADKTIYFIGTGPNYTIKMYNDANWYDMGTSTIDFSNYYTKAQVDAKVANNLTTTAAGYVLDARQGQVLNSTVSNLSGTLTDVKKTALQADTNATYAKNGLTNGAVTKVGTSTKGNALQGIYLNGGTPTAGTQLYNRNMTINGSAHPVIRSTNADIQGFVAPTSFGTSGQVLKSTGSTPSWTNWVIDTLMIANTTEKKTSGNYIFDKNITDYKFIMFELINEMNEISHEFLYTVWVDTKGNHKYILNKSTAGTDRYVVIKFDSPNVCVISHSSNLGIKAVLGIR